MASQSEAALENNLIKTLVDGGYDRVLIKDETDLESNFKKQLEKFNNTTFNDDEFKKILIHLQGGSIFEKAKKLRDQYELSREEGTFYVKFLNKKEWCKNIFQVTNQITMKGKHENRYDVTILINGLPLVQIELKKRGVELKQAFKQIQRYQLHSFHNLFNYVQIFVISNGVNTKFFSNNQELNYNFTFFWKDKDNKNINNLEEFADTFLEKCHLSKMISQYIVLNETRKSLMVLRAYQYYAVESILESVSNKTNGYVWHTTGSGKTLTSFKACQILAGRDDIDKVMFVVDRNDLDYQTTKEFNSFSAGAVDGTDNTKALIKQLKGQNKLIITTIQKLHRAVKGKAKQLENYKDLSMVLMFDECHRSQFGDMHKDITNFFNNICCYGFTGTPIFAENANNSRTTQDLFGKCLHSYLIKDAIHDENVLGFSIDYVGTYKSRVKTDIEVEAIDTREVMESEERLEKIVDYIIKYHDNKTYHKEFTSMFCVSSVPVLNKYYKIFKKKSPDLKIASIYSYGDNVDLEEGNKHPRDNLGSHIEDYNEMFGTNFSTDDFGSYYVDLSKRSKNKQIDILLVVNMFLTGFDNPLLNTLYVDKNLQYHSLIQAFSRTNRVHDVKKTQGNIVCFRNLKKRTDEAIRLFSDGDASGYIVTLPYEDYVEKFNKCVSRLLNLVPEVQDVDLLEDENDEAKFVLNFKNILRVLNRMTTFAEFSYDDLNLDEQQVNDYKSKYLDLHDKYVRRESPKKSSILNDIDFEIELTRQDNINVSYILTLLKELDPKDASFKKDVRLIHDLMQASHDLKSKAELIDKFIHENIVESDVPIDVDEELPKYFEKEKNKEISDLVASENLSDEKTREVIAEYEYSGKLYDDEIRKSFNEDLGFLKRRHKADLLKNKIINLVDKFALI
ncbi:type I restriction endonuclease subunit R [uncultured Methanobrevibacter sp.]|uniref:type I restriction endonuclease subunit R n=1 Tax=uncultured Methanobrevibacter sp. TaxID=253161 RepID=UPI00260E80EA|nr:type I restriction endonuclease subunit R [uncultured Methanobrevibacter sp.]